VESKEGVLDFQKRESHYSVRKKKINKKKESCSRKTTSITWNSKGVLRKMVTKGFYSSAKVVGMRGAQRGYSGG